MASTPRTQGPLPLFHLWFYTYVPRRLSLLCGVRSSNWAAALLRDDRQTYCSHHTSGAVAQRGLGQLPLNLRTAAGRRQYGHDGVVGGGRVRRLEEASSSRMSTVKAKFHYTDPTRTRPDPTGPARIFFCGETPLGPCWSGRVRVVEFSYKVAIVSTFPVHNQSINQSRL